MINGVTSTQSIVSAVSSTSVNSQSNTSLSSYQKEQINTLLENYDSSNLSSDDALEIVSTLKDAGVAPSEELASLMEDVGFDAKEIGDLAAASSGAVTENQSAGAMPPPPPPSESGNTTTEEEEKYITSLLDSLLTTEEDDTTTTASSVVNGVSFDDVMDYTSRIVNLNEESQDAVMTMLDELSSDENTLTDTQKATVVKQNLGEILSNQDNYNRVSYYA